MSQWIGSVLANSDDAQQAGTVMTVDDSPLVLSTATHWLGFRFADVFVPVGAAIDSAFLSVYVTSTSYDTPGGLVIYGQASASAGPFTTTASDISSRTRTTASVTWTGSNIGMADQNSPDIGAIVNEIINGSLGWVRNNPIALILDAVASTDFRVRAYESGTAVAQLTINYTVPLSIPMVRRVRTYVRM